MVTSPWCSTLCTQSCNDKTSSQVCEQTLQWLPMATPQQQSECTELPASLSEVQSQYGTITHLKKHFGFIKPVGSSLELFFHTRHLKPGLDASQLQIGLDVEYVQGVDPEKGRPCAIQVSLAPAGAAKHEVTEDADRLGHVIQWPTPTEAPRAEPGIIRYIDSNQKPTHLTFTLADIHGGSPPSVANSSAEQGSGTPAAPPQSAAGGLAVGPEWVLFKLCHRQQSQCAAQVSTTLGAKAGYRAVQVRRVFSTASLEMEHLLHMPVLEKLALILPR